MSWLSASLVTDARHAEPLADALSEAGALSTSIEDADAGSAAESPQFDEPGEVRPIEAIGWARSKVIALFDPASLFAAGASDSDSATVQRANLQEIFDRATLAVGIDAPPPIEVTVVEEQDWVRLTQSQFEPIRISDRLWIVPSWHEAPNPEAICIALDPGLAFGTGSHPTTRLCL
jgi:ribosomal protein L11 methyltransferase